MRIVVDTNLLVSGVISAGGLPRQLLDATKRGEFELCTSKVPLAELLDVLSLDKFSAQFEELRDRAELQPRPMRLLHLPTQSASRDLPPHRLANVLNCLTQSAAQARYAWDQDGTELWNRCSCHVPVEHVG